MSPLLVLVLLGCAGVAVGVRDGGRPVPYFALAQPRDECFPSTRYVILTSTRVTPSTVYATSIHHIPTTIVQAQYLISTDVTEWQLQTSTVVLTHTYISYPHPRVITNTETMTAMKYVTQVKYLTETNYATSTELRRLTDTLVTTHHITRTRPVITYRTNTITTTSTHHQQDTKVTTTTFYQYVTLTKQVPHYVTQTHTSYYQVYDTATVTMTEDEYVTHTSLFIQTRTATRCSSVMSYGG